MPKLNQGEEYEEDYGFEEDDEEAEYDDEDAELVIDTFFGVPKKVVYIGGAIILCLILFIIVFATRKSGDSDKIEEVTDTEYDGVVLEDTDYEEYEVGDDISEYVEENTYVEEEPVVTEVSELLSEDAERLRQLGYTGDEIELAISNGFDIQTLIDHATELRDAEAEDALKRMSDTASEEFQSILYYSYLGQPEVWNPEGNRDEIQESRTSVKINADYVKCPTRGNQLFLKCKIAQDAYVWYECPPVRWLSLPNEGNIVLNVDFWIMNDTAYVTNISEADSTLNSIDSSHYYEDISDGDVAEEITEDESGDTDSSTFLTE